MIDREKVMKWLETCVSGCEEGCPYEYKNLVYRVECKADLMRDALASLKEQEAVKPRFVDGKRNHFVKCGNCNFDLMHGMKFCPHCGQAVKWDD